MELSRLGRESKASDEEEEGDQQSPIWVEKLGRGNSLQVPGEEEKKRTGEASPLPLWKRSLDIVVTLLFLPLITPIFFLISLWIKLTSRGPVFFCQDRIGLDGEKFTFFKFRSMRQNVDTGVHESHLANLVKSDRPMVKLDELGDKRLIPGGNMLRAGGFDELAQLINVLRGDMSLVGPRPCTPKEYQLYEENQKGRFQAVPGITGYWQVKGKNQTSFSEMIRMDEFYVKNRSLLLDVLIILRTPAVLLLQIFDLIELRNWGAVETEDSSGAGEPSESADQKKYETHDT